MTLVSPWYFDAVIELRACEIKEASNHLSPSARLFFLFFSLFFFFFSFSFSAYLDHGAVEAEHAGLGGLGRLKVYKAESSTVPRRCLHDHQRGDVAVRLAQAA